MIFFFDLFFFLQILIENRDEFNYPFVCVGLNIVNMVVDFTKLSTKKNVKNHYPSQAKTFLSENDWIFLGNNFEEFFVMIFDLFHLIWLNKKAKYMEFKNILEHLKSKLEKIIFNQNISFKEIQSYLHLEIENLKQKNSKNEDVVICFGANSVLNPPKSTDPNYYYFLLSVCAILLFVFFYLIFSLFYKTD